MYRSEGSVYGMEAAMDLYSPMRRIWAIAQSRPTCRSGVLGRRAGPRHKAPAVDFGLLHRSCAWHRALLHLIAFSILLRAHRLSTIEIHSSLVRSPALSHPSEDENLHQKAPKSSDQSRFCC